MSSRFEFYVPSSDGTSRIHGMHWIPQVTATDENAKLSVVEMFIDEAFVECSIRQQGGSLCEVTMAELTSACLLYTS